MGYWNAKTVMELWAFGKEECEYVDVNKRVNRKKSTLTSEVFVGKKFCGIYFGGTYFRDLRPNPRKQNSAKSKIS